MPWHFWIINIPVSRQRICNNEMLEEIPVHYSFKFIIWLISDFLLCISLLYSSEQQDLSQSTTKWQGSCQALTSCALTPACDHSFLGETRTEYQMEIQGSSKFILLLVQLLTLTHQEELVEMFNLTSLTTNMFAFRHLWWKIASSIHFFLHAWDRTCTVLKIVCEDIHSHTSPKDTGDVQQQLIMK